jgi:hypothetical protein
MLMHRSPNDGAVRTPDKIALHCVDHGIARAMERSSA